MKTMWKRKEDKAYSGKPHNDIQNNAKRRECDDRLLKSLCYFRENSLNKSV